LVVRWLRRHMKHVGAIFVTGPIVRLAAISVPGVEYLAKGIQAANAPPPVIRKRTV
jgi:hypothetical protein